MSNPMKSQKRQKINQLFIESADFNFNIRKIRVIRQKVQRINGSELPCDQKVNKRQPKQLQFQIGAIQTSQIQSIRAWHCTVNQFKIYKQSNVYGQTAFRKPSLIQKQPVQKIAEQAPLPSFQPIQHSDQLNQQTAQLDIQQVPMLSSQAILIQEATPPPQLQISAGFIQRSPDLINNPFMILDQNPSKSSPSPVQAKRRQPRRLRVND